MKKSPSFLNRRWGWGANGGRGVLDCMGGYLPCRPGCGSAGTAGGNRIGLRFDPHFCQGTVLLPPAKVPPGENRAPVLPAASGIRGIAPRKLALTYLSDKNREDPSDLPGFYFAISWAVARIESPAHVSSCFYWAGGELPAAGFALGTLFQKMNAPNRVAVTISILPSWFRSAA